MPTSPLARLRLQLGSGLAPLVTAGSPFHKTVCAALLAELGELLSDLGIPGVPDLQLAADQEQTLPVRWFVHGGECHYPDELPLAAWSLVRGWLRDGRGDQEDEQGWVGSLRAAALGGAGTVQPWGAFFRHFAHAVLEERPSILFGAAQIKAYVAKLVEAGLDEDAEEAAAWLAPVLAEVLDMGLSIAELPRLLPILIESRARDRAPRDLVENLIAELTPQTLEIHANLEQIKRFSLGGADAEKMIPMMRDGLFYELGIRYPRIRFVARDALPDGVFAFKIHAWATTAWLGLATDERLVNDTVTRLDSLGVKGRPAINPANGNEISVIKAADAAAVEDARLYTWNEQGYLVLCLSAELRRRGARFVSSRTVDEELENLKTAFPDLVAHANDQLGIEQITRVLRKLASEEISIRNLRAILEHLLEFDYIRCDSAQLIVLDDRLPTRSLPDESWLKDPGTLANFVRTRLKRYITHKHTMGGGTLVAYLLDAEIEQLLARYEAHPGELQDGDRARVLAAIDREVRTPLRSPLRPVLLTAVELRSPLRRLIETRFPGLPVLCYQELSTDSNFQPVGRITL
jgi:hypothetical protein